MKQYLKVPLVLVCLLVVFIKTLVFPSTYIDAITFTVLAALYGHYILLKEKRIDKINSNRIKKLEKSLGSMQAYVDANRIDRSLRR